VQVDDAFKRPVGGRPRARHLGARVQTEISEERLNRAREFGEILRVALELFERFFVQLSQRLSFARDRFFDRAHPLIEISEGLSGRLSLCVLPLMKGKAETIQLRLEARQPLFKARIVLMHRASLG
jgi:hypothetical protein